jgi:transcriptional regulator with XRE-family HTH domain
LIITGEQFRAARAMARIEQAELARQANVSVETIKRLERTEGQVSANVQTVEAIRTALEAAGVEFTNGDQPGVRLRKRDLVKGISAYRALVELPDDVSDDELRPLVSRLLSDAFQSQVNVDTIAFEVAKQIEANFPRAVATQQDRMRLAEAMMELARAKKS